MPSSGFEHLGHLIEDLIRSFGLERKVKENQVIVRWPEIVGPRIAERATPERVEAGKLFVRVRSATWRSELFLLKPRIIEKIDSEIGRGIINDIVMI